MIYERIGWRYMALVNPAMFDEIMRGTSRNSVSRMKCLDYVINGGWIEGAYEKRGDCSRLTAFANAAN